MGTLLPAIGHPVVLVDRVIRSTDSRIGRVLFCSVAQVLSAIDQNAVRDGPDSLSAITRIGTEMATDLV
jgi:hypothetical protein